jgi:ribokinase
VTAADTTGAGDAFNAGLVHALARGNEWREALTAATRFATAIISRPSGDRYRIELGGPGEWMKLAEVQR